MSLTVSMPLQSQTWSNLRQLLSELPRRRVRLFILVLLASLVQGLLDVFLVALLARLVGLLAGARLDQCQDEIRRLRWRPIAGSPHASTTRTTLTDLVRVLRVQGSSLGVFISA